MTQVTSTARPSTIGLSKDYFPIDNNNIPTPQIAVDALNCLTPLDGRRVWECAVGEGYLARAMEGHGAGVFGTDLRKPNVKNNVRIYGQGDEDIRDHTGCPDGTDLVVTNPPYGALLRPFMDFVLRVGEQDNAPPIWFLLPQHGMASVWIHEQCGHLLRGYYPFTFGLPYLKEGKWVPGGAFKHAWTKWHKEPDPYGIDCQFITRKWIAEN